MKRNKEPDAPVKAANVHAYRGEIWVVSSWDTTRIRARHYDTPYREIDVSYLEFSASQKLRTMDDQVSLVLYKYRNQ